MIKISVTELKADTGKYIALAEKQDVFITKNGRLIAKLTSAKPDKIASAKSLFGLIHDPVDLDAEKEARLCQPLT